MSGAALVAITCTTLAVRLLLPAAGRPPVADGGPGSSRRRVVPGIAVVLGGAAVLAGSLHLVVVAVVAAGLGLGAVRLLAARRRERRAVLTRARVIELCDGLQAELAAGQTAGTAFDRAAGEWPLVAPVARTAAAGGDVPTALRALADEPGAAALRVVAAAWQVAHRTGHGLADTLGRVADDLRAGEQTWRIVAGELSSARATARLIAVLPFFALALGSGAGADPWRFLLGHPVGLGCLAGGIALAYAGLAWIDGLARDVERDT